MIVDHRAIERALFARVAAGDARARGELIQGRMAWAHTVARTWARN